MKPNKILDVINWIVALILFPFAFLVIAIPYIIIRLLKLDIYWYWELEPRLITLTNMIEDVVLRLKHYGR